MINLSIKIKILTIGKHIIIKRFNIHGPKVLDKGIFYKLNNLLYQKSGLHACGSFASNLVKTELLKNNKFPTEFNYFRDFLWCASFKRRGTSICPYYVSNFILEKEYYPILSRKRIEFIEKLLSSAIEDENQECQKISLVILRNTRFKKKFNIFRTFKLTTLYDTKEANWFLEMEDLEAMKNIVIKHINNLLILEYAQEFFIFQIH